MAERTYIVHEGQSIFDVVIQEYGTLDELFTIFAGDSTIDVNTDLVAGQEIKLDTEGVGDTDVKTAYLQQQVVTNNFDESFVPNTGDYDFQNDGQYNFQDNELYDFN